jgi:hypothetical protein
MRIAPLLLRTAVVAVLGVGGVVGLSGIAHADPANASIAGTVTDSVDGAPIGGIEVEVLTLAENGGFGGIVTGPGYVASAVTGNNGKYTVTGLDASGANGYWVCFYGDLGSPDSTYTPQCYINQPGFDIFPDAFGFQQVPDGSTTVNVAASQHVTGINAQMVNTVVAQPGGVQGTVTQNPLGDPLSNVKVTVFGADGSVDGSAVTGTKGTYEVDGLTSGESYFVCFNGAQAKRGLTLNSYKSQCWKKAAWTGAGEPAVGSTAVPVGSGQVVSGINAVLAATV